MSGKPTYSIEITRRRIEISSVPEDLKFSLSFQDVALTGNYPTPPTILVMPKHSSSGGNLDPQHNSIAAWAEVRGF